MICHLFLWDKIFWCVRTLLFIIQVEPKMIRLCHGSISVFNGPQPDHDDLKLMRSCYYYGNEPHKFTQIISLTSQNLVQLCNFMKRCRKEKSAQSTKSYLILFNFQPHRDSWRFLDVVKDFNLSVIIFGSYCVNGRIRELLPYTSYILDWHLKQTTMRRPIICVWSLHERKAGVARIFDNLTSNEMFSAEQTTRRWMNEKRPDTWKQDSFESMDHTIYTTRSFNTGSGRSGPQKQFVATASMNLKKACSLLEITEADVSNVELIRKQWKKKAFKYHPDKIQDDAEKQASTMIFTQLGEAKKFLINE